MCDIYCLLCGCPPYNRPINTDKNNYEDNEGEYFKEYDWLYQWKIMAFDGSIIDCSNYIDRGSFNNSNDVTGYSTVNSDGYEYGSFKENGYGLHKDCWLLIKNKYKIELNINHFNYKEINPSNTLYYKINYKKIKKYTEQYFEMENAWFNDKYIFESPLTNKKNMKRVLSNFNQCKIRTDRPSPSISATFFDNDERRLGNDEKIWIKKNDKWVHYENKNELISISVDKKNEDLLCKIYFNLLYKRSFISIKYIKNLVILTLSGKSILLSKNKIDKFIKENDSYKDIKYDIVIM